MDDQIHPTLDDYCSFCSLYKKSVSYSSKLGRISHVAIKLPKVEENRSIIFFQYWKRNIPRKLVYHYLAILFWQLLQPGFSWNIIWYVEKLYTFKVQTLINRVFSLQLTCISFQIMLICYSAGTHKCPYELLFITF